MDRMTESFAAEAPTEVETVSETPAAEVSTVERDPSDSIARDMAKTYERVQAEKPAEVKIEPEKTEAPRPANMPPRGWSAKTHEIWNSLPKEAQDYIAQRENQAQQRLSELGTEAKTARSVGELLQQFDQVVPRDQQGKPYTYRAFAGITPARESSAWNPRAAQGRA